MTNEKQNIGKLFNRIAGKYDFLNHLLSLNIDKWWRKKAVQSIVRDTEGGQCLDVAIGTADLAIEMARQLNGDAQPANYHIIGIDLSTEMMRIGEAKVKKRNLQHCITFSEASALQMPFNDDTFKVVTCAYGVRNFADLDQGLSEMHRVLKPEGQLMILEFSYPKNQFIAWVYDLYFTHVLPAIGRLLSKDKTAYSYLNRSVKNFVWGHEMCDRITKAGFRQVTHKPITFGITTIYTARK